MRPCTTTETTGESNSSAKERKIRKIKHKIRKGYSPPIWSGWTTFWAGLNSGANFDSDNANVRYCNHNKLIMPGWDGWSTEEDLKTFEKLRKTYKSTKPGGWT